MTAGVLQVGGASAEPLLVSVSNCDAPSSWCQVWPKSLDTQMPLRKSLCAALVVPPVSLTSRPVKPPLNFTASWTKAYTTRWSWSAPVAMPSAMRPMRDWLSMGSVAPSWLEGLAKSTFVNVPGAPVFDTYMPLPGDCADPSALGLVPARQPTAAITAPGLAEAPDLPLSGPWTTTSVTMLARKQSLTV